MAKRPFIDEGLCDGCETCAAICPEVFEIGDDGKSQVVNPDACDSCDCQEAINACPTGAIKWEG